MKDWSDEQIVHAAKYYKKQIAYYSDLLSDQQDELTRRAKLAEEAENRLMPVMLPLKVIREQASQNLSRFNPIFADTVTEACREALRGIK